jgi:hypothetical protein
MGFFSKFFSNPLRAVTAVSTFGTSEIIRASVNAAAGPSAARSLGDTLDKVYVATGAAIAGGVASGAIGGAAGTAVGTSVGRLPQTLAPTPKPPVISYPSVRPTPSGAAAQDVTQGLPYTAFLPISYPYRTVSATPDSASYFDQPQPPPMPGDRRNAWFDYKPQTMQSVSGPVLIVIVLLAAGGGVLLARRRVPR